jgi:YbgC/YbaW family acyl-CoA thioester hydrolase
MPFVWKSRVRYGDTDASGRIFYAALLRHFDAAETEFLRHIGFGYDTHPRELGFPRVHVECDFVGALEYDDLMEIAVSVERIGRTSFTLQFDVSMSGQPAARGKITVVAMDRAAQKSTPLPEPFRAALEHESAG